MEKKIKSVKLKNDYRTEDFVYLKGHIGEIDDYGHCCRFRRETGEYLYFSKSDIENNKTDLFEIEYEPERKFIDVRIEYEEDRTFVVLTVDDLPKCLSSTTHFSTERNFKVTELPEVYTREDMEGLARWVEGKDDKDKDRFKNIVDNFMRDKISERKSNGR